MPVLRMTWDAASSERPAVEALDKTVLGWWPELHSAGTLIGLRMLKAILEASDEGATYEMRLYGVADGLMISVSAKGPGLLPFPALKRQWLVTSAIPGVTAEFEFGSAELWVEAKIKKAS